MMSAQWSSPFTSLVEPGGLFPFYQSGLGDLPFPSVAIGEDPPTRNFLGIRCISLQSYLPS